MRYSAEKAGFHFIHNKGKYSVLILVYAISITAFMSCLNLSLSCAGQLQAIRNQTKAEDVELSFSGAFGQEYAITPQDIKDYPEMEEKLFYFPYRDSYTMDSDWNEYRYHCCFLSDAAFVKLFGMEREAGAVYIGRDAYETLNGLKARAAQQNEYDYLSYYFEGDAAYLGEQRVVDLSKVHLLDEAQGSICLNSSMPMFSMGEDQISLSDCLILPLEMMKRMENEDAAAFVMVNKCVIASYQGERNDENITELMAFCRLLAERHPGIQYGISDRVLSLEKSASDLMIPYRSLLLAAVSMLLIIMTGMIGVFILILHRRKKEQAVSLAYGATKSQIFLEVFWEVFLCFAVGALLAGAAAWYVTPRLRIAGIGLTGAWHGLTVWCAVGITLAEALGISGIALAVVGRENVAGTLKEL
ncbi:MAG: hypothetical protein HDR21_07175 [Lachnospiraceae bacterium]|nr:hypothetical protein [Lachnospiraceae bacterium]MBD5481492.1 hypothetical protein [Lachnospiraceae bacterium]